MNQAIQDIKEGEGRIAVIENDAFTSKLIKLRTGGWVTHIALITRQHGRIVVYESDLVPFKRNGVAPIAWGNWRFKDKRVELIDKDKLDIDWNRVIDTLQRKYDIKAWFKHLGTWVGIEWKRDDDPSNAFTCSEWGGYICHLDDWYKMTPKYFEQFID